MSYTRQVGYLVGQAIEQEPEKKQLLLSSLNMTLGELERLCVGRLFLSFEEEDRLAETLGITLPSQANYDTVAYQSVVHCMTPFSDPHNLDTIMDFIDSYIDAEEALSPQ